VAKRVSQGGRNIPKEIIIRRYYRGLYNLVNLYQSVCDRWMISDNAELNPSVVASSVSGEVLIFDKPVWEIILQQSNHER
jgi:predicted ABC-type ATPase